MIKRIELMKRYKECDSKGHIIPDEENNYCNHCFRHLNYVSPIIEAIRKVFLCLSVFAVSRWFFIILYT